MLILPFQILTQFCLNENLADFNILAFQNPKFKILAFFKILAYFKTLPFQNPEFKILADFNILASQNPKFKILAFQNLELNILPDFKMLDFFKILAFQNPDEFKILALILACGTKTWTNVLQLCDNNINYNDNDDDDGIMIV